MQFKTINDVFNDFFNLFLACKDIESSYGRTKTRGIRGFFSTFRVVSVTMYMLFIVFKNKTRLDNNFHFKDRIPRNLPSVTLDGAITVACKSNKSKAVKLMRRLVKERVAKGSWRSGRINNRLWQLDPGLSDCNCIRTHSHLVHKQTLNHNR